MNLGARVLKLGLRFCCDGLRQKLMQFSTIEFGFWDEISRGGQGRGQFWLIELNG